MNTLKLAAIYNILWGSLVIFFPHFFFELAGMERTNYPEIWQCVGMIVGVYGVGYWLAAQDPIKHYPIVLVGFLGKIFGPIGFAQALITGRFPLAFGIIIIFNDLIWWAPFYKILREKHQRDKTFLA
jgi:small multidrug resistance pump